MAPGRTPPNTASKGLFGSVLAACFAGSGADGARPTGGDAAAVFKAFEPRGNRNGLPAPAISNEGNFAECQLISICIFAPYQRHRCSLPRLVGSRRPWPLLVATHQWPLTPLFPAICHFGGSRHTLQHKVPQAPRLRPLHAYNIAGRLVVCADLKFRPGLRLMRCVCALNCCTPRSF